MATQQYYYGERSANYASSSKSQTRDPDQDTLKSDFLFSNYYDENLIVRG